MTLNTSRLRVTYYACTITPVHQPAHEILGAYTNSKDMIAAKLKNRSCDPKHAN